MSSPPASIGGALGFVVVDAVVAAAAVAGVGDAGVGDAGVGDAGVGEAAVVGVVGAVLGEAGAAIADAREAGRSLPCLATDGGAVRPGFHRAPRTRSVTSSSLPMTPSAPPEIAPTR